MDKIIEMLNKICQGWETNGSIICNPNIGGGIIDQEIVSGEWFIVFNDDRKSIEGFDTAEDAAEAFAVSCEYE